MRIINDSNRMNKINDRFEDMIYRVSVMSYKGGHRNSCLRDR